MYKDFFLFLLEEDELRGYFPDWPARMLVAIMGDVETGFSLVLHREEERHQFIEKVAGRKGVAASEVCVIPKIDGHPSMNIKFKTEQDILSLVHRNEALVEEAEDYSLNYQYEMDEGKRADFTLEDEASEQPEDVIEETKHVAGDEVEAVISGDDTSVPESAETEATPASPDNTENADIEPVTDDEAEVLNADQTKVEGPEDEQPVAADPAIDLASGFITPEEASKIKQVDGYVRIKGNRLEVSPTNDVKKVPRNLREVLVRDDLSALLVTSDDIDDLNDLMKKGFMVNKSNVPDPLIQRLTPNDDWCLVTLTQHQAGLLISPTPQPVLIEPAQLPAVVEPQSADVRKPSRFREAAKFVMTVAAAVLITLASQGSFNSYLPGLEPQEEMLTDAELEDEYFASLRDRVHKKLSSN